jgi:hypothetical protein
VARHRRAAAGQQRILELDQRRLDPDIALRGERSHQALDGRGLEAGLRGKQVGEAGRQQGASGEVVHLRGQGSRG